MGYGGLNDGAQDVNNITRRTKDPWCDLRWPYFFVKGIGGECGGEVVVGGRWERCSALVS